MIYKMECGSIVCEDCLIEHIMNVCGGQCFSTYFLEDGQHYGCDTCGEIMLAASISVKPETLAKKARLLARNKGHQISRFTKVTDKNEGYSFYFAACMVCVRPIYASPKDGGIQDSIHGEAADNVCDDMSPTWS